MSEGKRKDCDRHHENGRAFRFQRVRRAHDLAETDDQHQAGQASIDVDVPRVVERNGERAEHKQQNTENGDEPHRFIRMITIFIGSLT